MIEPFKGQGYARMRLGRLASINRLRSLTRKQEIR
jgi:hypothetical protein